MSLLPSIGAPLAPSPTLASLLNTGTSAPSATARRPHNKVRTCCRPHSSPDGLARHLRAELPGQESGAWGQVAVRGQRCGFRVGRQKAAQSSQALFSQKHNAELTVL